MTDDPASTFGRWLQRRMDESQPRIDDAELGRRAQVAATTVGRWRRGETRPGPDTLRKIAPILGVDYSDLLALSGYGRPADTLGAVIEPQQLRHPLAIEIDRMLADGSPLPMERRKRLEALLDAMIDPDRRAMRPRRRPA